MNWRLVAVLCGLVVGQALVTDLARGDDVRKAAAERTRRVIFNDDGDDAWGGNPSAPPKEGFLAVRMDHVGDCGVDTACFIGDPYRNRVLGSVKLEPRVRLFDRRSVTITTARMVEVFHGKPEGRRIVVNARAAADGAVRVEAREATSKASKPIPGFTANDSKPITGDGVRLAVSWGGKGWTHLPKSPNIVLRFQLKKAELFAYEIEV